MDITGSRCGLEGAEAVLKLRVLRSNDDWDRYWHFHLAQERKRVHDARYLNPTTPAAPVPPERAAPISNGMTSVFRRLFIRSRTACHRTSPNSSPGAAT